MLTAFEPDACPDCEAMEADGQAAPCDACHDGPSCGKPCDAELKAHYD